MKRLLILTALVVLSGCGDLSNSESRPTYNSLKASLSDSLEKWHALGVADYSYRLEKNCFCDLTDYLITVHGGQITEVVSNPEADDPKTVAADSDDDILTIDELFAQTIAWANRRPDELEVTIDPTYFIVTRAFIDHREGTADDEVGVTVSGFKEETGDKK